MSKANKAGEIAKLLGQGRSVKTIKKLAKASESYIYLIKKQLEAAAAATAEEAMRPVKETILSVANTMFPEAGEYVVVEGAKSAQEVDAILNERASTYGAFKDVAKLSQQLKNVIRLTDMNRRGGTLPLDHQEALDMIASKIARIVIGDYDHVDSWVDIAGYATLVADRLQGKVR
jgi:hypothetical protein